MKSGELRMEFQEFPKIARLKRECMISEKIDGTNAQIVIAPREKVNTGAADVPWITFNDDFAMAAGSRSRYLTPTKDGSKGDNFGFAKWVQEHAGELWTLGEGRHYGEWWGSGIQRGYGLTEKRFSLFNAWRWNDDNPNRPACCHVVPVLYTGPFSTDATADALERLRAHGSVASPGFMKPEGIVTFLSAARAYFKQTLENDDEPKSKQVA